MLLLYFQLSDIHILKRMKLTRIRTIWKKLAYLHVVSSIVHDFGGPFSNVNQKPSFHFSPRM